MAGVAVARAALAAAALAAAPAGGPAQEPVSLPRLAAAGSLADDSVDAIRALVPDGMSRFGIPGLSLAVARGGTVRFEAGFGFADVETGVRARPETVYRLASVSKLITAVAVMRLAQDGRLDLDAPASRYCPDFPEKPWPVTSRQLLCHQGGVRHYRPGEQPMTRRVTSLTEGLALFRDDPLAFEPGTKVLYSTYGYTVLGCVAAVAAGRPFPSLLHETVFEPARMSATRLDYVRELIPHRAAGYVRDGYGRLLNSALADMSHKVPGAGLCATAGDVARFGAAFLSGRLVSPETREQMLTRQRTRDGRVTGFGLGFTLGQRAGQREAWHTGGHERVSTVLYLRPDDGLAVAILANLEKVEGEILALARRVADLVTARTAVSPRD